MYFVAFCFAAYIVALIFNYNPLQVKLEHKASLLSAIGIIISAFIASLSVMISIDNTNKIEWDKTIQRLHSKLDTSFYMLEKNKENIRLSEEFIKARSPLFHKNSINNTLEMSLKNLNKLEICETISPTTISRIESYILAMIFILEKSPEVKEIKLPKEFDEQLNNFKDSNENSIKVLTKSHC